MLPGAEPKPRRRQETLGASEAPDPTHKRLSAFAKGKLLVAQFPSPRIIERFLMNPRGTTHPLFADFLAPRRAFTPPN